MPNHSQVAKILGIPLDGDAETVSASIAARSTARPLSVLQLAPDDPVAHLVAYLMARRGEASIEKDEIAAFVRANRSTLSGSMLDEVDRAADELAVVAGELAAYVRFAGRAIRLVLANREHELELRSDRLLWLCIALAWQTSVGMLTHGNAREVMVRPDNRRRIDHISLGWMINDAVESHGEAGEAAKFAPEYAMLIAEGCLLLEDPGFVYAAFTVLRHLPPAAEAGAWVDVIERCAACLATAGTLGTDERAFLDRARARFGPQIRDEDL